MWLNERKKKQKKQKKNNNNNNKKKRCKLDFVIQNSNKIMCDYKVYYYLVVY